MSKASSPSNAVSEKTLLSWAEELALSRLVSHQDPFRDFCGLSVRFIYESRVHHKSIIWHRILRLRNANAVILVALLVRVHLHF